ncbi:MAG TPA: HlyD family efflux transporter periplasmic adaptor subunit [Rhodanobacteraceae bacterium]|nr:HlyD family efflux transporter periplasmic adaptor subunit [Rhodanobacteraceae bacterium]
MKPLCRAGALLATILSVATLAACSGGNTPAAPQPPPADSAQSQFIAIARGRVDVEGGLARVVAQRDGVISAVDAQQGDAVKAGQPLAQLDPRAAQIELEGAKAQVEQARAQLAGLQVQWHAAKQRAPRLAEAARAGAASEDAATQARDEIAGLQAQRDAAQAALDVARQHVAAAQLDVDARSLRAPVAGRIVQRDAQIGQSVSAQSGAALFVILPDRPRIVRAELDADDADRIRSGMVAQVVRDSGEGATYTATVLRVGEVLGPGTLNDDPLARAASREVECVLRLDSAGAAQPLRIGQRVLVRFPRR